MDVPARTGARVRALVAGLLVFVFGFAASAAAQQSHVLVVSGLGGAEEYRERFHRWAVTLVDAAADRHGLPADNIIYLGERPDLDPERIDDRSTWENVQLAMSQMAERVQPNDFVLIVLIGHGSFTGSDARFNVPGPDPSPEDFAVALGQFSAQRVAFVNTASASGPFIAALSAENRTVITATKTGRERNETRFGEFFVNALAGSAEGELGDAADINKDGRTSLLEAFNVARTEVARVYEQDGLLLTEHAMLDDNGDGQGSDEPDPISLSVDGRIAQAMYLTSGEDRTVTELETDDPALLALYEERRALQEQIAAHTLLKDGMDPDAYQQALEVLFVELALKNRDIRQREAEIP